MVKPKKTCIRRSPCLQFYFKFFIIIKKFVIFFNTNGTNKIFLVENHFDPVVLIPWVIINLRQLVMKPRFFDRELIIVFVSLELQVHLVFQS